MSALRKVLVVDDDPVVGKSFKRVLSGKGYIVVSPMARVDAPRFVRTEVKPLTAEQTTHLLDVAETAADPLRALWTVAAYTGMRKGELLGLTWADVDFETCKISVRRVPSSYEWPACAARSAFGVTRRATAPPSPRSRPPVWSNRPKVWLTLPEQEHRAPSSERRMRR